MPIIDNTEGASESSESSSASGRPVRKSSKVVGALLQQIALNHIAEAMEDEESSELEYEEVQRSAKSDIDDAENESIGWGQWEEDSEIVEVAPPNPGSKKRATQTKSKCRKITSEAQ
jgi:hypothetical protein